MWPKIYQIWKLYFAEMNGYLSEKCEFFLVLEEGTIYLVPEVFAFFLWKFNDCNLFHEFDCSQDLDSVH